MVRSEMMKPSSIPLGTPKMHLLGLSLMLFAQNLAKVCSRSATNQLTFWDMTMYTSTIHLMRSPKHLSMQR
jgi:hypothetical protein